MLQLITKQSSIGLNECPVCCRPFASIKPTTQINLHIKTGNDQFELSFKGDVCVECYLDLVGINKSRTENHGYKHGYNPADDLFSLFDNNRSQCNEPA